MSTVDAPSITIATNRVAPSVLLGSFCLVLATVAVSGQGFPDFVYSSLFVIAVQVHLVLRFGIFSVPSLFSSLLAYPALIPFISGYIFGLDIYAVRGLRFQSPATVNKALFLIALALGVFVFVLWVRDAVVTEGAVETERSIAYSSRGFKLLVAVFLVSAYLTAPGPTILTADYDTILKSYYSWANFAGSLFIGSWLMLYLQYRRRRDNQWIARCFYGVSFVGVTWLLLHNRQNESIGVLAMLAIDTFQNEMSLKEMLQSARGRVLMIVFSVLFTGQIFADTILSRGLSGLASVIDPSGGATSYPGGAQNIYGGFQATVHLFSNGEPFFLGRTFLQYPIQSIPTGIVVLLGLPYPSLFSDFLGSQYVTYLGGVYYLNTYYANFGVLGIVLAGALLGYVAHFASVQLRRPRQATFLTGCAGVAVAAAFRAMWYTQLNWIDSFQGYLLAFFLFLLATNAPRAYRKLAG